jgi:hypothetical protein
MHLRTYVRRSVVPVTTRKSRLEYKGDRPADDNNNNNCRCVHGLWTRRTRRGRATVSCSNNAHGYTRARKPVWAPLISRVPGNRRYVLHNTGVLNVKIPRIPCRTMTIINKRSGENARHLHPKRFVRCARLLHGNNFTTVSRSRWPWYRLRARMLYNVIASMRMCINTPGRYSGVFSSGNHWYYGVVLARKKYMLCLHNYRGEGLNRKNVSSKRTTIINCLDDFSSR